MSYTKTQWVNDQAPAINATNLNKIEQGIYDNDAHIGTLSNLTTTTKTDAVSAINEVVSNAGDLTTLTTTTKSSLVGAVNELDSDKLDATATAVNATQWNGTANDLVTENNVDTWIPVMNGPKLQHTTVSNIGSRINTISTGNGTADYTYINSVENNHWERSGNVVSYAFTMRAKGNWGTTTAFISGLPRAQTTTRFLGLNPDANTLMRFAINTNGGIENAYSQTLPANEQVIEGQVTYITKD